VQADYVVLGGGNAKLLKKLPPGTRLGDNSNAFQGGYRLWARPYSASAHKRFIH
jgi:polyphosphate glucokinase